MQIIVKKVPNNFNVFCFSCKHTGSLLSSQNTWEKMLDMVCKEYDGIKPAHNYCVDHGDCIEGIAVDDPRFDLQTTTTDNSQVLQQAQHAIYERKDIKNQLITILKGNHEHKVMKFGNMTKHICDQLGVMYGTYSSVIHYVDRYGKLLFKHYAQHGAGTIKSVAEPEKRKRINMQIALIRKFRDKFGDCLLNTQAHIHKLIVAKPDPLLYLSSGSIPSNRWKEYQKCYKEIGQPDSKITLIDFHRRFKDVIEQKYTSPKKTEGYIEPNHRWYAAVGSFLQTFGLGFDSYSERFGYDPLELGFVCAKIRNKKLIDIEEIIPASKKEK